MLGYSNRNIEIIIGGKRLKAKYPIEKSLCQNNELYAYWLSGNDVMIEHQEDLKRYLKKLILPHPDTIYLKELRDTLGVTKSAYDFPRQILSTTEIARRSHIPVKWHLGFTGIAMTICTSENDDGWIHLETTWPFVDSNRRPIVRVERKRDPDMFNQQKAAFDRLWDSIENAVTDGDIAAVENKSHTADTTSISHSHDEDESDRTRVLKMLRERQAVGEQIMPIARVATFWYGGEKPENEIDRVNWNTKFRLLKMAVNTGVIAGRRKLLGFDGLANIHTEVETDQLITYFQGRKYLRTGDTFCYFSLYRINNKPVERNGQFQLAMNSIGVVEKLNYWISPWGVEPSGQPNDPYYSIDERKPLIEIVHEGGRAWDKALPMGDYRIDFNSRNGNWYERLNIYKSDEEIKHSIRVTRELDAGEVLFDSERIE